MTVHKTVQYTHVKPLCRVTHPVDIPYLDIDISQVYDLVRAGTAGMGPDALKNYSQVRIRWGGKKLTASVTHYLPESQPKEQLVTIPGSAIPEFHTPAVIELNVATKTDIFRHYAHGSTGNWLEFIISELKKGLKYVSNQYQRQTRSTEATERLAGSHGTYSYVQCLTQFILSLSLPVTEALEALDPLHIVLP